MAKAAQSLNDYAEAVLAEKRKGSCWVCQLSEAQEINEGRKAGMSFSLIAGWLIKKGYPKEKATGDRIREHFRKGHAE